MKIRAGLLALVVFVVAAPPVAAEPSQVPPDYGVAEKMKTGCRETWFWSGKSTEGVSVMQEAQDLARKNQGVTLEIQMDNQGIRWPSPDDMTLWRKYSGYYAAGVGQREPQQSDCEVWKLSGAVVRPDSVWNEVEFPTLEKNVKVVYVWEVKSGEARACILWWRISPPPHRCEPINR